MGFYLYFS